MNEIKLLFEKLDKLTYPDTMFEIRGEILRKAFFPGGKGTLDNSDTISDKNFMILGQDWGTKKWFDEDKLKGEESIIKSPTWRNIFIFLDDVKISHDDCFYTNAIMGVRREGDGTGKTPAFKDKVFIKNCQEIFLYQIEVQKPKVIFVLGLRVAEFLAETSSQLTTWSKIKSFKAIDDKGEQIKENIVFDNSIKSNLVLLMHPSCRKYNLDTREYKGETGRNAQIKMTKEILK